MAVQCKATKVTIEVDEDTVIYLHECEVTLTGRDKDRRTVGAEIKAGRMTYLIKE